MKKDSKLLWELAKEKKRNFRGNLDFVRLHAQRMIRAGIKNQNMQQKQVSDSMYKRSRKLEIDV